MFLRQYYDAALAQASYMIGCQATGEAIVIDPLRDVSPYIAAAADEGLRITAVTETHIHADFASGSRELAARTGATIFLSAEGGEDWQYRYGTTAASAVGDSERVARVRHGDRITIGNIWLDVLHTPGHTPEHLSFVVTDSPSAAGPMGILTGDFVFVGDVGRPDLLERAAHVHGSMEGSARALFKSLEQFRALPDHLQVWPGHGAGSACGKALGAVPSTTVGYEKLSNWAVGTTDETEFLASVLDGQPEPPPYFAQMKRINRDGPAILGGLPQPCELEVESIVAIAEQWEHTGSAPWLLDLRPRTVFAASHIPGAISLPYGKSFTGWAGTVLPYDADLVLLVDGAQANAAARALAMIGLDRVIGWADATAVATAWHLRRHALAVTGQQDIRTLPIVDGVVSGIPVIDVREQREWDAGHLPGARHLSLAVLADHERAAQTLPDGPFAVHCQSGARSMVAASLLQRFGRSDVLDLTGGYAAWLAAGLPIER